MEDNISDRANGGKMWDHITDPDDPSLMKDSLGEVFVYPVSGSAVNNLFGVSAVGLIALLIFYISPFLSTNVRVTIETF